MEKEIKIIVVDDHKAFRIGLVAVMEMIDNVNVIGDVATGNELFRLLQINKPDIIFMDINLTEENGIDLTRRVLSKYQEIVVIAITSSDEAYNLIEMLDAGASAFILKNAGNKEIQDAIDTVRNGKTYFSREFLFLTKQFAPKTKKKPNIKLSDREREILGLICKGMSNKEIANIIDLSIHTVDTHRRNLLDKTGARNTASLVMIAFRDELGKCDNSG